MDPDGNKSKDFLRLSTIMPYDVTLYDLLIEMKLHYITITTRRTTGRVRFVEIRGGGRFSTNFFNAFF